MTEMEQSYKQKYQKTRLAGNVALSIKTGKTEYDNPVSKARLKEMYDELRQQWPKIKHHLKSNETDKETVQTLIQKRFEDATHEMEQKKEDINKVFELKEPSSGQTSQKVKECRQSAIQNLQLALYYSRKDGSCSKTFLSEDKGGKPQDVLEYLSCDCYWLGCLLALNNPPLWPDWENHDPGMDPWNMLPRNIRAAFVI